MAGRMRQLCQGVNVDLGTAAAFREQWAREAGLQRGYNAVPKPLLLRTDQAPGDAVAMTAAVYSLHKVHPGKYVTAVQSYWPEVFEHNPDVVPVDSIPNASWNEVRMHYPAIHQSNERGIHFMQAWCEFLGSALGISIPLLTNRPRLYFSTPEPKEVGDYWVVCSGGKRDFTNKLWGYTNYTRVVQQLSRDCKVKFVQVGGARPPVPWDASCAGSQEDDHPLLMRQNPVSNTRTEFDNVQNMVGKTTLRQLFDLVRYSRGVLCGVSLLMHVAAALGKPAVVVAGGREPVAWNAYPNQQYVHTVGALPCRDPQGRAGACWRARVVPLGDGTILDKETCQRPVDGLPECMRMIRPNEVVELILRYNRQYEHALNR